MTSEQDPYGVTVPDLQERSRNIRDAQRSTLDRIRVAIETAEFYADINGDRVALNALADMAAILETITDHQRKDNR